MMRPTVSKVSARAFSTQYSKPAMLAKDSIKARPRHRVEDAFGNPTILGTANAPTKFASTMSMETLAQVMAQQEVSAANAGKKALRK